MKRFLLCLILSAHIATAAIAAGTAWDVRTTGSNSNGGGFNTASSGTDYSQGSAQCAYTDLVIGATNTQLTSVGCPFTSAYVGNVINVTGGTGFTVGRYQVVSVSVGVATMDRAVGTAASTGGTGNLGGSLLTIATALTPAVDGNVVYIQNGTYTQTTALVSTTAISVVGYATTHSDNGTKPLITTATNSTDLWHVSTASEANYAMGFQNLSFTNTAGTPALGITYANSPTRIVTGMNLTFSGFTHAIYIPASSVWLSNVEIKSCTGDGYYSDNSSFGSLNCQGCYIHGNTGQGIGFAANGLSVNLTHSIVAANSTNGIGTTNNASIYVQALDSNIANNTSDGIHCGTSACYIMLSSTIVYGNGGYGVNLGAGQPSGLLNAGQNNAFGSNASGNFATALSAPAIGQLALTANPFMSASNFALNATSGGGPVAKQAGYPGTFPGGTTIGYVDVGAAQTQGTGSAGNVPSSAFVADLNGAARTTSPASALGQRLGQ